MNSRSILKSVFPVLCALFCLFSASAGIAGIAVIPYRVENPSQYFSTGTGSEYARLLGVAMAIKKGTDIYSPRKLDRDLKSFSLSPQDAITREQLNAFGKGRSIDLIIVGTLEKRGSSYIAESMLYSAAQQRIVARSRAKEDSLYECAEKEAGELLFDYPDRLTGDRGAGTVELAVLFDASYNSAGEREGLKQGILNLSSGVSDGWEIPLRVYLVPYSDAYAPSQAVKVIQSPAMLRASLDKLKPKGGADGETFERAMGYALKTIPWRKGASKILVAVSNSPLKKASYAERHAMSAQKKNITVYTVSLGKQDRDDADLMRQIAVIGKGRYYSAAYHQRVYDVSGKSIDLFMESGRLFRAGTYGRQWKEGLFQKRGDGNLRYAQPKPYLSEMDYNERRYQVSPYSMGKIYSDIADISVINSDALENNTDSLLEGIGEAYYKSSNVNQPGKSVGKVLLSEGHVSLWVRVNSPRDLEFFAKQESSRTYFLLGVSVRKKADEPYGITFSPASFITRLSAELIPKAITASLNDIIEKPEYYTDNGLFRPPVWFIKVKAEKVERSAAGRDIRDER